MTIVGQTFRGANPTIKHRNLKIGLEDKKVKT